MTTDCNTHRHTRRQTHTHTHTHTRARRRAHTHILGHTHAHACTHVHAHAHTHTHTRSRARAAKQPTNQRCMVVCRSKAETAAEVVAQLNLCSDKEKDTKWTDSVQACLMYFPSNCIRIMLFFFFFFLDCRRI